MRSEQPEAQHGATLLLVDDDPYITKSIKRALYRKPYRVLTADGGAAALSLMETHDVDLVISDVRMPAMDGATLLVEIRRRWPDCIRMLLTGHVDIAATIQAINDGHIYRYITKPWDDAELLCIIEQSLAHRDAEQDRERLRKLAHEQNEALQRLNETLEARVRERTAELSHATALLDKAYSDLQHSYVTATEVFSSLINQRLPRSRQTNRKVIELVRRFCELRDMDAKERQDLEMAAALYNIGKLTWRDEMIALPLDKLESAQTAQYRQYPRIGENLLTALEPAQRAAQIIYHHQERWDGMGFPERLYGEAIPWGARLLKLAVDYIEMQMGMIMARPLAPEEALDIMKMNRGALYDPALFDEFLAFTTREEHDAEPDDADVLELASISLVPGMIIARNLYSAEGTLLLSKGKLISERLIEKLRNFENNAGVRYTFHVKRPEQDSIT
ncbi:HD domain-containing phosphohydrolase [Parapusillimonas granuli]|uniref:Response regulator n=1 Tax=Parapusillimonas granuli TaxID=380911 RepID=A0A853G1X7_9BURK|nr:HD domain-containing phosphohydrolase [Parapusillimonas granuli]MBB5213639.1 response regulator RpfG family c-di-GMP phosphodiesterase [Parapusillimonas granuli]MEB2398731.1 response regulator [Alcaligenaceae bacterium]NYT48476.1 response regulator [Parapusillimonas granuli]